MRGAFSRSSMAQSIIKCGLTTNLKLALDAGDAGSYTSGQSWLDLTPGGYDFFRGTTSGSNASDPTFNGTVGNRSSSEYWSFDGGDFFTYDSANEAWMNNLHKNNALFSMAAWIWPGSTAQQSIFGNNDDSVGNIGLVWQVRPSDGFIITSITNGVGLVANLNVNVGMTASSWQFVGISLNEPNNVGFGIRNGNVVADAGVTYASPSAAAATYTSTIGQAGNGTIILPNTSRLACLMAWEARALSATEMLGLFERTRGRFGV